LVKKKVLQKPNVPRVDLKKKKGLPRGKKDQAKLDKTILKALTTKERKKRS